MGLKKKKTFVGYNLNFEFYGTVFLPYCLSNHWCLLVLDMNEYTITHYDPYKQVSTNIREQRFLKYLRDCERINPKSNNLHDIKWKIVPSNAKRPLQKSNDTYNCGCYIIHYMESIDNKKIGAVSSFDPYKFRIQLVCDMLDKSLPVNNTCLGCMKKKEQNILQCIQCLRWMHISCAKTYLADSFICRLCERSKITDSNKSFTVQESEIFKIGFINPLGSNTCWLNSCLQVLLYLPVFDQLTSPPKGPCSEIVNVIIKIRECMKKGLASKQSICKIIL